MHKPDPGDPDPSFFLQDDRLDAASAQPSREIAFLLRDLVHARTGIFFEEKWINLFLEKILPLTVERAISLLEFFYRLKYDDLAEDWAAVVNALSVQETYFWREMPQVEALVGTIVPAWLRKRRSPLRVWSAACATGEEPLSIAIALHEAGFDLDAVEIVGSDASGTALARARNGVYRERSFRSLPAPLKEKYFSPVQGGWKVSPEIARRVTYTQANLVAEAEIGDLARSEVIFCRNVFIYFSRESIRRVLITLSARMPAESYLFVGVSESLLSLTRDFSLEQVGDAFVYLPTRGGTV